MSIVEALQVQVVTFNNEADVVPALAYGQIDVALAGPSAALATAVARGTNIKIVGAYLGGCAISRRRSRASTTVTRSST